MGNKESPPVRRHGEGIYSRWAPSADGGKGEWVYFVQYRQLAGPHIGRYTERAGTRLKDARKLKSARYKTRFDEAFIPPHIKRKQEKEAKKQVEDARAPLLYEVSSAAFLKACASEYADPSEMRCKLNNRLALAFRGRYLDEITKRDVRQYFEDRLANRGPFKGNRRKVGLRAPQTEITALSALYSWMQDDRGYDLENPCHKPRTRRQAKSGVGVYRPKHKAVIPSGDQLDALFAAAPNQRFQAFLKLSYYTAARPESEAAQLTHGDVELPDRDKVQTLAGGPILGTVTYRETKTGEDRTVPLHPDAETALRAVIQERPSSPKDRGRWPSTPIFSKRGKPNQPWGRNSYRNLWTKTLATVAKEHPDLKGMWLRDLRKAAITHMRESGTDGAIAGKLAGHTEGMSDHYYTVTGEAARRAILSLKSAASPAAAQKVQSVQSVSA